MNNFKIVAIYKTKQSLHLKKSRLVLQIVFKPLKLYANVEIKKEQI